MKKIRYNSFIARTFLWKNYNTITLAAWVCTKCKSKEEMPQSLRNHECTHARQWVECILASSNDKPIGVISAAPSIIGDAPMRWQGKFMNDQWGRPIYEDIEVRYTETISETDENGEVILKEVEKTRIDKVRKINPNYDPNQEYIPRENRKEWDAVGLLGKLLVEQDGTLIEGGYCKPITNGIATNSESGFYVMQVLNESQALILFR